MKRRIEKRDDVLKKDVNKTMNGTKEQRFFKKNENKRTFLCRTKK